MQFLRVDGLEPDCTGCEYKNISQENDKALALYNLASPAGKLDHTEIAMTAFGIRRETEKKQYLKKIGTIHQMIEEHYASK